MKTKEITINENDFLKSLTALERKVCLGSFFEFVKSFWGVIIKEEPVYNWHIPELCKELEYLSTFIIERKKKPYDLIINIPPGTTKSTIVSVMWPAWLWAKDPTLRIITNTYQSDLSIDQARLSRDIVTSGKYKRLFPEVSLRRDKSGVKNYSNTEGGERKTSSTGAGITGKHAHLIINDDPLNTQEANSDADRETAINHLKTLSSRKIDKANTITVLVMQRLHKNDPTGYTLKKKGDKIKHIKLPAQLNEAGDNVQPKEWAAFYKDGYLDPVRLNQEVLDEALLDLGSLGYANQFKQETSDETGGIIKKAWFRKCSLEYFIKKRTNEKITFYGDLAYTEDNQNDPSGFIATCTINNDLYIFAAKKVYMEFPDLVEFIKNWTHKHFYNPANSIIKIEPKASGLSAVQQLRRLSGLNITFTESPKDDKMTRLTAAAPKVEAGRVFLIEDTWNEDFIQEVSGFPTEEHDEYVDVLSYAVGDLSLKNSDAKKLANLL